MVVMYNIAGRQVGSHWLAITTLAVTFGGSFLASRGGSKEKPTTPPINAGSKDEEKFIQYDFDEDIYRVDNLTKCREFLQQIEQEDKKNKIAGKA